MITYYECRNHYHSRMLNRFVSEGEELTESQYDKLPVAERSNYRRKMRGEASDPIIDSTPQSVWPNYPFDNTDRAVINAMQQEDDTAPPDFGGGTSEGAGASGSWNDDNDSRNDEPDTRDDSYDSGDNTSYDNDYSSSSTD